MIVCLIIFCFLTALIRSKVRAAASRKKVIYSPELKGIFNELTQNKSITDAIFAIPGTKISIMKPRTTMETIKDQKAV